MNNETAAAERDPYPIVAISENDMEIKNIAMQLIDLQRILAIVMNPMESDEVGAEPKSPEVESSRSPVITLLKKQNKDLLNISRCISVILERLDL